jgi:Secretion system C-terminal sorting domain
MNNKFLLTASLIAGSLFSQAQQSKLAYAITGDGNNDYIWMNIRQVDLNTGEVVKTLFERSKTSFQITDVNSQSAKNQTSFANENIFTTPAYPTGTMVAAAAFDKRTNKLFFTPMRKNELRWLDLSAANETPTFYTLPFVNAGRTEDINDEAANITRMVIGADGNGYAMSNDGNHFYTFTTGKKTTIKELGNIIDAESNNGTSIHNKCSSWGGDMIADAFGKLYVISANHNVFLVDIDTRIATYKGNIQGLPAGFTTNAAAVNEEGEVVLASANLFDGYYKMKITDLKAVKMVGSNVKFNTSDFANANLLFQKEANSLLNSKVVPTASVPVDAKVFPNPVTNSSFNILFDNAKEGRYRIILSDLAGRNLLTKSVRLVKGTQIEKVNTNANMAKGVYFVKVIDDQNAIIINEKIVIQ